MVKCFPHSSENAKGIFFKELNILGCFAQSKRYLLINYPLWLLGPKVQCFLRRPNI